MMAPHTFTPPHVTETRRHGARAAWAAHQERVTLAREAAERREQYRQATAQDRADYLADRATRNRFA